MSKEEWQRQVKEMENVQKEVEGSDERDYGGATAGEGKKNL